MKRHTISVLVNDHPGVLQRVAGLFGRRGFNIDSITVGESEEAGLSRMVIVTTGDDKRLEQVNKQLHKLIDVIRIAEVSASPFVERELALIRVSADARLRPDLFGIVEAFRASIVDIGADTMIIQAVGDQEKIDSFIGLLRPYGILELTRTGLTAMSREEAVNGIPPLAEIG
ncbi:acetolactate synthase small subunit [Paenibacillus sp. MWE-103]|uniref:Acetolactate synthase small subunit n=1 Tax=Paenibacillus artemisiicola TaxID=1172618 RepID=A0ABS3W508_9BACL|nr:acetolactate synthase small subunit [Paenibacillus artemisiicola]MBO7743389.1 acetolactate synthase small subunit [Paenibacillus artemisiicola]